MTRERAKAVSHETEIETDRPSYQYAWYGYWKTIATACEKLSSRSPVNGTLSGDVCRRAWPPELPSPAPGSSRGHVHEMNALFFEKMLCSLYRVVEILWLAAGLDLLKLLQPRGNCQKFELRRRW
jgi:hypothetical protein